MDAQRAKAWRCTVCGYIHAGDEAPDACPVCGAVRAEFEPYEEPTAARPEVRAARWQCLNCNYVHEGGEPPDVCPICGAVKDKFEPAHEAESAAGARAVRVTIVGGGIAGVSAAETIRIYGKTVDRLAPEARHVVMADGGEVPYDALILALGSHPHGVRRPASVQLGQGARLGYNQHRPVPARRRELPGTGKRSSGVVPGIRLQGRPNGRRHPGRTPGACRAGQESDRGERGFLLAAPGDADVRRCRAAPGAGIARAGTPTRRPVRRAQAARAQRRIWR